MVSVSILKDEAEAKGKGKPAAPVNIHFLGTCSGGGPIVSRSCSSTAVDFGNDVWLFDVADGTLSRLQQSALKMSNISRIFITHMHGDHVLGLVAVIKQVMTGVGVTEEELEALRKQGSKKKAVLNIYGPHGVRELIRTCLRICSINLSGAYAVHEMLEHEEEGSAPCDEESLPPNEAVGLDLKPDAEGVWRDVLTEGNGKSGRGWNVSAGPLQHRGYILTEPTPVLPLDTPSLIPLLTSQKEALASMDPPITHPLSILSRLTSLPPRAFTLPNGQILHPPTPSGVPPRKIVIFGDCAGGTPNSAFEEMCSDPSLLVHECTNAAIPSALQKGEKGRQVRVKGLEHSLLKKVEIQKGEKMGDESHNETSRPNGHDHGIAAIASGRRVTQEEETKREEVRKKAKSRGHSTPKEVGEFARRIRARRVVINHFSAMFPSPRYPTSSPLPSLLIPISPFPNPVPYPQPHSPHPPIPLLPLTERELHLRIIMQSIIEQVPEAWADPADSADPSGSAEHQGERKRDGGGQLYAVAARDFMVLRMRSHEMTELEIEDLNRSEEEAGRVLSGWAEEGGIWVEADTGGHEHDGAGHSSGNGKITKRWIGTGSPPPPVLGSG